MIPSCHVGQMIIITYKIINNGHGLLGHAACFTAHVPFHHVPWGTRWFPR